MIVPTFDQPVRSLTAFSQHGRARLPPSRIPATPGESLAPPKNYLRFTSRQVCAGIVAIVAGVRPSDGTGTGGPCVPDRTPDPVAWSKTLTRPAGDAAIPFGVTALTTCSRRPSCRRRICGNPPALLSTEWLKSRMRSSRSCLAQGFAPHGGGTYAATSGAGINSISGAVSSGMTGSRCVIWHGWSGGPSCRRRSR